MADKLSTQLFGTFFLFFVLQLSVIKSVELESVQNLEQAQKGDTMNGVNQIKKYLKTYGYYHHDTKHTLDDQFDDPLESALKTYQEYLGIDVTGRIDSDTIQAMLTPRCGVPDGLVSNYSFPGAPYKWRTRNLAWSIRNSVTGFTEATLSPIFAEAWKSWADVSPFSFREVKNNVRHEIDIGFFPNNHGDGNPFGRAFAHAYYPTDGRVHFNENWNWTSNPTKEKSKVDVQSIAVHEFGHALGLDHSSEKAAVMYAFFNPGIMKRDLTDDDKKGIKALYPS
ncbi:hypothetical protein F3Y22_tig00110621pilonHSYRG00306 [Hibiscus syriacus]|uniref:Peptidase metallopeptidase domain-containing protein n=1 Tax=Hibiscus syriacus TaxID=106335 RepID=A0A6A2ZZK5_HIBSY|nr:metalloendoproteinase 1-MMP-like [Hibiscus syriacus]KAE8697461.1 hypothetical protein F3Y22_tig00110621pilonHSYRG00306 [Hibiscus syriacus]